MNVRYLIKNGTIVDGTGAPAYRGDVRIRDGRIAEIGPNLRPQARERLVDATPPTGSSSATPVTTCPC
jgi:N-acyl-D-aspartate/D-glutamate deacylase